MQLIRADRYGKPMGYITDADIDFEIGEASDTLNDFSVTFSRRDWDGSITYGDWLYVPETEFGGIVSEISTSTQHDTVTVAGNTWRGMLCKKIIQPKAGQDYVTVDGWAEDIMRALISDSGLGEIFAGITSMAAQKITNFRFDRYCTLHEGIIKMLRTINQRIKIATLPGRTGDPAYVWLTTEKIRDFSESLAMSEDASVNFSMIDSRRGVNHLICLGKGELRDRLVIHLYADDKGRISETPYYTGADDITEVYDSSGSEAEDLRKNGVKKLMEVRNRKEYSMTLDRLDLDVDIGDIVGGRDHLTGVVIKRPIGRKIWTVSAGKEKLEYKLEGDEK